MKKSDVKLIQRVLSGDDAAFSTLVRKYQRSVHALAWRKLGDFHVAEEITQDTFLKAYQKLSTLKEPQRFSSWLYVIAANRCKAWLRKKRLWTQSLENTNGAQLEKATYSGYVIAENERTAIETQREVVKKLLAKLQESDRTVITLYYLGEMTYEEISEFLGVSVSAIKNRLYRARQRLKKEEPMVREVLGNFQITPNLTENIMREIWRMKPVAPSGSKPLVPWAIAFSTLIVVFLMLGVGNGYLSRFQKPYSFDAASEMTVEIIEAPVVLNLESKPDIRTQFGGAATASEKSNVSEQKPDEESVLVATVESDETVINYTQWQLPEKAKARFGKGGINVIEFSPDGTQLAVGSSIGVWLYDVETGNQERSLFAGKSQCLAFSSDGRFLASSGGHTGSTEIQVWEVATGREMPLIDRYDSAAVLQFASDGKTLVSLGSSGNSISRLNVKTGRGKTKHLKTGLFGIGLFSSEDFNGVYTMTHDKIAIGKEGGKIQLWDVTTRKKVSTLRGHIDLSLQSLDKPSRRKSSFIPKVLALAFSRDGTRLASGSKDETVRLWNINDPDEWVTLRGHTGWTNVLVFSSDGKMLASGSTDKTVRIWDTTTGESLATFTGHINGITALAFSPDGKTLVSGSTDGTVRFWQTETGVPMDSLITGHTQSMKAVTFFEDRRDEVTSPLLASVAFNGVITFWDVETSQRPTIQTAGHRGWFPTLAFSPDGTKLASVGAESTMIFDGGHGVLLSTWRADHLIRLTDVSTGRELATLQYGKGTDELTFSPDGKTVAFGGSGEIRLWNTETGEEREIPLADLGTDFRNMSRVSALGFSPDGARLASATQQEKIKIWDVVTGEALTVFTEPTGQENLGRISAVAFSPDGTLLAAGAHSQVHLWNVNTGDKFFSVSTVHKRGRVRFHNNAEPLMFSPDGAILVNGTNNGTIQVWDITKGDQIAALDGHTQGVETLKFSPDGKTLVSTAMDGTILLWDWDEIFKDASVPTSRIQSGSMDSNL